MLAASALVIAFIVGSTLIPLYFGTADIQAGVSYSSPESLYLQIDYRGLSNAVYTYSIQSNATGGMEQIAASAVTVSPRFGFTLWLGVQPPSSGSVQHHILVYRGPAATPGALVYSQTLFT